MGCGAPMMALSLNRLNRNGRNASPREFGAAQIEQDDQRHTPRCHDAQAGPSIRIEEGLLSQRHQYSPYAGLHDSGPSAQHFRVLPQALCRVRD